MGDLLNKVVLGLLAVAVVFQISCGNKGKDKVSRPYVCVDGQMKNVGIIGGKTISKEAWLAKGLVAIQTEIVDPKTGKDVGTLCTGTLIAKNLILTAAHCVDRRKDGKAESIIAFFGIEPVCDLNASNRDQLLRTADQVVVHRGYNDGLGEDDDLALVRLSEDAPSDYHTVELADELMPLDRNQKIYVSGYGSEVEYNDTTSDLIRLKYAEVRPFVNNPNTTNQILASTFSNETATMAYDQRHGQGACAGDSGGPSLIRTSGALKVLGVASKVKRTDFPVRRQEDVTCKQASVYTSVYFYKNWIETSKALLLGN